MHNLVLMDGSSETPEQHPVSRILRRMASGEEGAANALFTLVYDELLVLARGRMLRPRLDESLQPTALVHEAWLQLVGSDPAIFDNRAHFFGAAGRAMRMILVDHARSRGRDKRGGGLRRVEISSQIQAPDREAGSVDILALDEALRELEQTHERPARVVTLRYFAGLTNTEVADVLGVVRRTIDRDWQFAKAWLRRALMA